MSDEERAFSASGTLFRDRFQIQSQSFWIFAYGSLIFRPGFVAAEAARATLHGYARRFWQGSPDHRGTFDAPGRVVTLVPAAGERCVGVAYRLAAERAESVLAELDFRERAGFVREPVRVIREGGEAIDALTYRADPHNPHFLGDASLDEIVREIAVRSGPSGTNRAYVIELAKALRELGVETDHVFEVEAALAAWLARERAS